MSEKEIIEKVLANKWWPFDRVDPLIMKKIEKMDKQK